MEGEQLPGGWTVGKMLTKKGGTGSTFSVGYIARDENGRECYLKAMDYHEAMTAKSTPAVLKWWADMYGFEKNICEACRNFKMDKVVHAIETGSLVPRASSPYGKVEYIIFELADGDIRRHLDVRPSFDAAFMLRVVHDVGVAIQQMHEAQMAHQDIKPSNVLILKSDSGAKIADLGRAWAKAFPAPHDDFEIPGDPNYAPPELMYRDISNDHRCRRFAADLYHYGNIIVFVFARAHFNTLLLNHLDRGHWPNRWGGTYRDVLPYIHAAFGDALAELQLLLPEWPREELLTMVRQLCEPDPEKRGHPLNHQGHQQRYSLARYISRLDLLSHQCETRQAASK